MRVGLQPRPRARHALDQIDDDHRVHRALDGHSARLALALPGVAVAQRQQRAGHVHPEVAGYPGAHLGGVHVAAVRVGHQRRTHLQVRRSDADGTVHRVHRQVHREVAEAGGEPAHPLAAVQLPDPHHLGQRVLQGRRQVGGGQRAELGYRRRRRPVAGRFD